MDKHSQDPLERILQKLEDLDEQVKAVGERVARLEGNKGGEGDLAAAPAMETELMGEPAPSGQPAPPERGEEKEPELSVPPAAMEAPAQDEGPVPLQDEEEELKPAEKVEPAEKLEPKPARAPVPPPLPVGPNAAPAAREASGMADQEETVPPRSVPEPSVYPSRAPGAVPRSGPKPKKPRDGESLEMKIAGTWLPRIGVLVLALVLILYAREHVQGPVGKVVGSYLLSLGLVVLGLIYSRRYPRWSSPVLAGGLAFSFFATYAMGFVEPMRLLDSLGVKLALLAVNLAVIFGFAQWRKSEVMAGTALVLGYLTTGVVGQDVAALGSCVALSIISVVFLWLNRWFVATAVAAACSYAAWLYVHRAVPALDRGLAESFWFHFTFLSLLFVVFVAASKVGADLLARVKMPEADQQGSGGAPARLERILTVLAQTNIVAYISAVVWVLYRTEVYWETAWLYFFPMAGVSVLLGWIFRRAGKLAAAYLAAAAACVAFGIMSAASPHWLPVFLALQALAMLIGARDKPFAPMWNTFSVILVIYASYYIFSDARMGFTLLPGRPQVEFPWWVHGIVAGITLAFSMVWERYVASGAVRFGITWFLTYFVALLAGFLWVGGDDLLAFAWKPAFSGAGVALLVMATACGRSGAPVMAIPVVAWVSVLRVMTQDDGYIFGLEVVAQWIVVVAAVTAGLWVERSGNFSTSPAARLTWRMAYIWGQIYILGLLSSSVDVRYGLLCVSLLTAGSVAMGWAVRSAAIAKSSVIPMLMLVAFLAGPMAQQARWTILLSPVILLGAALPFGLPGWQRRTGDTAPQQAGWYQGLMLIQAGIVCVYGLSVQPFSMDPVFTASAWGLIVAVVAVAGGFAAGVYVLLLFAALAALFLWAGFLNDFVPGQGGAADRLPVDPVWALGGVALLVAAERVVRFGREWRGGPKPHPFIAWPGQKVVQWVTIWMAVGTLVMAVVALRMVPELRVFYFTGAMVAAAFVWIVLGFWFGESIYRRSGLILLCFGLLKGLVWDVLSLKNTVYRQISWTILGVLAIVSSFLYNRFRGRVDNNPGAGDGAE